MTSANTITAEELQVITRQLADIEMPPAPDWQPLLITAGVLIVFIAVALMLYRVNRQKTHPTENIAASAIAELNKLQQQWQQKELNDHHAAYRLCTLLRIGLQLRQLTATPPQQLASQASQWQSTIEQLKQLRYDHNTNNQLNSDIFEQIRAWLNEGRTTC